MDEQDTAPAGEPVRKAKVQVIAAGIFYAQGMPGPVGELRSVYEVEVSSPEEALELVKLFHRGLFTDASRASGLVTANIVPPENLRNVH